MDVFQLIGIQQSFGSGNVINIDGKSFTGEEAKEKIKEWINILETETPSQIGDRLLKLSAQLREEEKRRDSENLALFRKILSSVPKKSEGNEKCDDNT